MELLTCCVWLTWSNLSNLCLCPQAWIAFQFPFSPRLTVISCCLNSSACLAVDYSLQRGGESQCQESEPPFLLHMLCTGKKRVNLSGQHSQACQRCAVIAIPLWECAAVVFQERGWVGTIVLHPNKTWAPVSNTLLKSQSMFCCHLWLMTKPLVWNPLQQWTKAFLHLSHTNCF